MRPEPDARRPTPLAEALAARIRREGPVSVADYMDVCLHDPLHGYYRGKRAIGRAGDFVTAPEISQVFGELIGLWCAVTWQQMGAQRPLRLIELGPGRGTLMRDALRAARAVPDFRGALEVLLVESNEALAELQRAALANEDVATQWRATLDADAERAPVIVIANEFLDTLPVAQWVLRGGRWRTRCVGLDADGKLSFTEREDDRALELPAQLTAAAHDGDIFETRTSAFSTWAAKLAALGRPMAALFIDYGHAHTALGDTLQAIHTHRYDDPLRAPGEADLTAQVDFASFAAAMTQHGLACDGPVTQAAFLAALGITERASRLMNANPAKATEIETAIARLMAPSGMGTRFCAIGVRCEGMAPLPGLGPVDIGTRAP